MAIKCRANNPATCRYHGNGAGNKAANDLANAELKMAKATSIPQAEIAKAEFLEARDIYDATEDGYANLRAESREARSNGDWLKSIEITSRIVKAKIVRAEERQQGVATETLFLTTDDMKSRLDKVEKLVSDAGSDRYLDILDKYKPAVSRAISDNDTYTFTKAHNELVNELQFEASESRWFDVRKGQQWVADAGNLKIKGKVVRSLIPLDNPSASLAFEA